MEITAPAEFGAHATPVNSAEIDPDKIQRILLRRVLSTGISAQVPMQLCTAVDAASLMDAYDSARSRADQTPIRKLSTMSDQNVTGTFSLSG